MRKFFSAFISLLMITSVVACGNGGQTVNSILPSNKECICIMFDFLLIDGVQLFQKFRPGNIRKDGGESYE